MNVVTTVPRRITTGFSPAAQHINFIYPKKPEPVLQWRIQNQSMHMLCTSVYTCGVDGLSVSMIDCCSIET